MNGHTGMKILLTAKSHIFRHGIKLLVENTLQNCKVTSIFLIKN